MRPSRAVAPVLLLLAAACCRKQHVDRVENPATGEKPFDLVAADPPDDAGLPLAPRWQHQWQGGQGFPDPAALCMESPRRMAFDRCSAQQPTLDVAASFADVICSLGTKQNVHGHVNWWPATYGGNLYWKEAAADGDYTLELVPSGDAALVPSNGKSIHVEFDGSETVYFFDSPWWNDLRDAVDSGRDPGTLVTGQEAVLTGLFGLDCEHQCHVELHPVYVFALHVNDADDDDGWAFFARNAGNEGFCSQYLHVLPLDTVAFRIPWRCGATSVALAPSTVVKKSRGVNAEPRVTWAAGEGVVVEVDLPRADPGKRFLPRVHGEIHLAWTMGAPCAAPKAVPRAGAAPGGEEEDEPERRLEELLAPSAAERGAGARGVAPRGAAPERDEVGARVEVRKVDRLPVKARARASARAAEATEKLDREARALRAACEASRRSGESPKECEEILKR